MRWAGCASSNGRTEIRPAVRFAFDDQHGAESPFEGLAWIGSSLGRSLKRLTRRCGHYPIHGSSRKGSDLLGQAIPEPIGKRAALKSVLYVSRSRLDPALAEAEVSAIVALARPRNASLDVSGALAFAQASFAQVLEGPEAAVDDLMSSITNDERHERVRIIDMSHVEQRRFEGWSMAYSGPSFYVNRHIKPLLASVIDSRDQSLLSERLIELMYEFVRGSSAGQASASSG